MDQSVHSQLLDKVREYVMPPAARELLRAHLPLIIVGITASGKNTVTDYIQDTADYKQVVTHTTRPPRPGEVNTQHYHFISDEEMLNMMTDQAFVEVQTIHGEAVYGISISAYRGVIEAGHKPLLIIDVQGVEEISQYVPELRPVFLLPTTFEEWMSMLEKRGQMSHSERLRRMHSARDELQKVLKKQNFTLVVNRDVASTAKDIVSGINDYTSQHKARDIALQLLERLKTI